MNKKLLLSSLLLLTASHTLPIHLFSIGKIPVTLEHYTNVYSTVQDCQNFKNNTYLSALVNIIGIHGLLLKDQISHHNESYLTMIKEHIKFFGCNALLSLGATTAHEMAHAALNYNNATGLKLIYSPLSVIGHTYTGGVTRVNHNSLSPLRRFAISVSGPICGALFTYFASKYMAPSLSKYSQPLLTVRAIGQVLEDACQLYPSKGSQYPSDGQNALDALREWYNQRKA